MLQLLPTLLLILMQGTVGSSVIADRLDVALLRMAACTGSKESAQHLGVEEDSDDSLRLQILSLLCAFDAEPARRLDLGYRPAARIAAQPVPASQAELPGPPDHGWGGLTRDGPAA